MTGGFTVRYRSSVVEGPVAFLVEDERGAAYLFREGTLQLRIRSEQACEKLAALLGGSARWDAVPRVAPYSLSGLWALAGGARTAARPATIVQPAEAVPAMAAAEALMGRA
jgi:hypothetical protein